MQCRLTLTLTWKHLVAAKCKALDASSRALAAASVHPSSITCSVTCRPPLIVLPRSYRNRNCPGVSLSTDITTGWGPEVMLFNAPPPGVYRYKVHQYSAAGTLRHVDSEYCNPFHLTFSSGTPVPSSRSTALRLSLSFSARVPTPSFKVCPAALLHSSQCSYYVLSGGFWNLFSFTVAADGGITLGGQAQTANCEPPRLQGGNIRLADCRSNGCRVEVLNTWCFLLCIIVTLCSGAEREPLGHSLRRWLHRSLFNLQTQTVNL
jgi:hypothetical protein